MKAFFYILFFSSLLLLCFSGSAQNLPGSISYVIDGDTFIWKSDSGMLKIRMAGIDAPEKTQFFGAESRNFLCKYLHVPGLLQLSGYDKYGRCIAFLFIDSININLLAVQLGYAWYYERYYTSFDFAIAELNARTCKLGLWFYSNPMAPWNFRKLKIY
jgi:micrococcal nuclease